MASLSSVLDNPRGASKPSTFDALFADNETRATPVDVQTASPALAAPSECAIAPLLTDKAAMLGMKFFRYG